LKLVICNSSLQLSDYILQLSAGRITLGLID